MNEILLLNMMVVSAVFVLIMWNLGKERLYSSIIVFLILVAITGGKMATFFGFITNVGNVFYASIFLATYFLIERYGKKEGVKSIWIGVISVIAFSALIQFTVDISGLSATQSFDEAFHKTLGRVPWVAFSSLLAYIVSQIINVYLYSYLKEKMHGKKLWLRANISNTISQIVDSILFFSLTFSGVVLRTELLEIIVTGFLIKVIYMMLASPLLYLNRIEEDTDKGSSTVTFS